MLYAFNHFIVFWPFATCLILYKNYNNDNDNDNEIDLFRHHYDKLLMIIKRYHT